MMTKDEYLDLCKDVHFRLSNIMSDSEGTKFGDSLKNIEYDGGVYSLQELVTELEYEIENPSEITDELEKTAKKTLEELKNLELTIKLSKGLPLFKKD